MTPEAALELAERNFPQGPETLVDYLRIKVHREEMTSDGWCLDVNGYRSIRVNSSHSVSRQRFTLAHELGHLILGIPAVAGETVAEAKRSLTKEERRVDEFASELLLPTKRVEGLVPQTPVTAKVIERIASAAKVSQLAVVVKLARMQKELSLQAASVVFYKNDVYDWQWSWANTLTISSGFDELLAECLSVHSAPYKLHRPDEKDVVVCSIIENPHPQFGYRAIFVQIVDEEIGLVQLDEEKMRELENFVYNGDKTFQSSLNGCLSMMKIKMRTITLENAVRYFYDGYVVRPRDAKYWTDRWDEEFRRRLDTSKGREYIKLYLKKWTNPLIR